MDQYQHTDGSSWTSTNTLMAAQGPVPTLVWFNTDCPRPVRWNAGSFLSSLFLPATHASSRSGGVQKVAKAYQHFRTDKQQTIRHAQCACQSICLSSSRPFVMLSVLASLSACPAADHSSCSVCLPVYLPVQQQTIRHAQCACQSICLSSSRPFVMLSVLASLSACPAADHSSCSVCLPVYLPVQQQTIRHAQCACQSICLSSSRPFVMLSVLASLSACPAADHSSCSVCLPVYLHVQQQTIRHAQCACQSICLSIPSDPAWPWQHVH